MACSIERNNQGRIVDVKDSNGNSSKLFREIHGNLFLADVDTSLKIYSNFQTDVMQEKFGQTEPPIVYNINGNIYSDLETLLIAENDGMIEMGVMDPGNGEFLELASMNTTQGIGSELASLVRQGFITAERELTRDGETVYSGKGEFPSTRKFTANMAVNELLEQLGQGTYEVDNHGKFTIKGYNKGYTEVKDNDGNTVIVETKEIPNLVREGKIGNALQANLDYIHEFDNPRPFEADEKVNDKPKVDQTALHSGLMNFLKSLGFSTATMEEYRKRYNTKYGKDPDIAAIADIANQIVAGDLTNIDNLSEEVAHIAIEMYNDQKSIAGVLASIHTTEEYAEFYDQYKEKYSQFYEGVELEDQIRKEILGKILKKTIQERFSTENKTESEVYLIQRLKEIWDAITNFITSRITKSHYQTLENLNAKIADSILESKVENFTQDIGNNTSFFYNLMSQESKDIQKELLLSKRNIEYLFNTALGESIPDPTSIEKLLDIATEYEMVSAVNEVIGVAQEQMKILKKNVEAANKGGTLVSIKDKHRYAALAENLIPAMDNMKVSLSNATFTDPLSQKKVKSIIEAATAVGNSMSFVEPLIEKDSIKYVDAMLEKALDGKAITPEERAEVIASAEGGGKDITWAGKFFGLVTQMSNPVLRLLSQVVSRISTKVNVRFLDIFNPYMQDVVENDWAKYQRSVIQEGTHYMEGAVDLAAYDKDLYEAQTEFIADIMGKDPKEIAKIRGSITERDLLKTDENYGKYRKQLRAWKENEGEERRKSPQYYIDRDARFDEARVDQDTRDYLSSKNSASYARNKKYERPDKSIDYSLRTESERDQDEAEKKSANLVKNPRDSFGNLKRGLIEVQVENLTQAQKDSMPIKIDEGYIGRVILMEDGMTLDDLPQESRRSLDMFNLDMLYRRESAENPKVSTPTSSFKDAVRDVEDRQGSAYDWVQDNGSIKLTSEYYEGIGGTTTFNKVAQEYIDSIEDISERDIKQAHLDNLMEAQAMRGAILKQNKYANSAIETDVHSMTDTTRDRIKELDDTISEASSLIGLTEEYQLKVPEMQGETALNEDFEKKLAESGMSAYDFSLQHMTERKSLAVRTFSQQLGDIVSGKSTRLESKYDDFINEMVEAGELDGLTRAEATQKLKDLYAKRNVASYFKRYQPAGYTQALDKMKSGGVKISDMIEDRDAFVAANPEFQFIEIIPEYSWAESTANPAYDNNNYKEGMPVVPRMDKYLNNKFFEKYGIAKEAYLALKTGDISQLTPTRNIEEFNFLVDYLKKNAEIIEMYGETGKVSPHQRIQINKGAFEKHVSVYKNAGKGAKENVKDFFDDISRSRKDEKEYGEVIDGVDAAELSVKSIPRYYLDKLDNPNMISENTIESLMVAYKAALRYQERVGAEGEVKALLHKIRQQKFRNNGGIKGKSKINKKGEVSNTYQKAQEMADYHFYGVRENRRLTTTIGGREIDLTQIFGRMTKYVSNVNLGFSPIVDITSYTTGVYNNLLDRVTGNLYGAEATNGANAKIGPMIIQYLSESGKMDKKSDLNHLIEYMRVFDPTDRVQNSAENRLIRVLGRSRFAGSKLANLPITPRNMLAVLLDYKFVDGKFVSYQDFHRIHKLADPTISAKSSKALWSKETDTFFDNLKIDPNKGVMMGDNFRGKFENPEEEFAALTENLIEKITEINQNVDSIISETDQTMAQRDVLLSSLMLHRSWIVISLTKKFKGRHFNFSMGSFDEGQYRTATRLASKMFKTLGKEGSIRQVIQDLEGYELANLRRTAAEVVILSLLAGLANALLEADDDDDTFVENLAQLIAIRTTSEAQSSSFIGVFGETASVYEKPLVQVSYLENFVKAIKKDPSYILKNTYYKRHMQFSDLQEQIRAYHHFNGGTLVGVNELKKK